MHNNLNRLLNLIENHHLVVHGERHVWQLAIIGWRIRQILGVPNCVITRIANRPTTKPRQSREMWCSVLFQHRMQVFERVVNLIGFGLARLRQHDLFIEGIHLKERPSPEKTVSADPFTANDAFKQERILIVL